MFIIRQQSTLVGRLTVTRGVQSPPPRWKNKASPPYRLTLAAARPLGARRLRQSHAVAQGGTGKKRFLARDRPMPKPSRKASHSAGRAVM